jgi:two-component system, OmpR family, sensor histidine kinase QseC
MSAISWLKERWRWLREPTLVNRSAITVLGCFFVIWAVLLTYQYFIVASKESTVRGMRNYGEAMLASVNRFTQAEQAAEYLKATEQYLNTRRKQLGIMPGELSYQLRTPQGQLVYQSRALPPVPNDLKSRAMTLLAYQGRDYALYQARSSQWVLTVVDPRRTDAEFLIFNAKAFLPFLLLALPFVTIPVWLSMRHGLLPLRKLADKIRKRHEADLSPIGFHAQHAELKPLEHALDDLINQLRMRLSREHAFVQDAAHELRTPLAVIAAQAHAMAHTRNPDERSQAMAHLEQAIERASHVSSQLLSLAAIDQATEQPAQTVDLVQWVRARLATLSREAICKEMELSMEAPEALIRVIDEAAFESVLLNLLDNAIRYGHTGGAIVVSLQELGAQGFELTVSDDGPGIAIEERERVFERFYRIPGQTESGSGLGLAIVQQALRRMRGEIFLEAGLKRQGLSARVTILGRCE